MSKILLDYFFKITAVVGTPAASTAFLKQVCVVVSPITPGVGVGVATLCTSNTAVAALTNNTECQQLFNAGMSRVYVLPMDDLDLSDAMDTYKNFFTVLISSDFDKDDINATKATGIITVTNYTNLLTTTPDTVTVDGTVFTAQAGAVVAGDATFRASTDTATTAASLAAQINAHAVAGAKVVASVIGSAVTLTAVADYSAGNLLTLTYADNGGGNVGITLSGLSAGKLSGGDGLNLGTFEGVTGVSSTDDSFLETQAAIENRCAFHTTSGNKAKNMFYAFGSMLSNASSWKNQQYISLPVADDVDTLGEAENLFDLNISHCIVDDEFANRLGLFACGGVAIIAPYVQKNIQIDMQSAGLTYVSANQPAYSLTAAALIEDEFQKIIDGYIDDQEISSGTVSVTLEEDDFVATADIVVSRPRALWRIFGNLTQV